MPVQGRQFRVGSWQFWNSSSKLAV